MALGKYFLSEAEPKLDPDKLDHIIRHALLEDIGRGDITTLLTIPKDKKIKATIVVKKNCILCGLGVAEKVFKTVDKNINFITRVEEGQKVKAPKVIISIYGLASSILSAERVALNLLSMLSGIATKTREYVDHIEPYKTKITDTRKTLPGLRELQKYAVRVGGGHNHRMGLDEMILIKDNHIKVTEGYEKLPSVPKGFKIEIEVQNLEEFKHALYFKPDVIMLDNMDLENIKKAVKIRDNTEFKSHHLPTMLEASGGVDFDSVRKIAASGVDIISVGELTHSIETIDMSLDVL
ncbi:MAG: carboxylating nicotinate-nucleotide diphosphorylase [Candidatus Omnitrophica bacterium]|nr:carboxylating nicotinate-nucleotide diphosphorylase [Candidatus Omnitrophota bacterium]